MQLYSTHKYTHECSHACTERSFSLWCYGKASEGTLKLGAAAFAGASAVQHAKMSHATGLAPETTELLKGERGQKGVGGGMEGGYVCCGGEVPLEAGPFG